ncbi:efflux RND transporter periplasmic adaptor subunit [Bergeriella denitrificans]|uniref:Antibiotic resistance efflux pump component n=1 Tax=Bergeriella denitrificans TaxID=494 RepID=A0A378UJ78_BERDE|nr:efflux RND transporter periplasmic adaptor subunit [Bergeriella denitrificans]STZ76729.1 antibiotic resistance efflux pump component [Bergeriella denitrificans]
MTLHPSKVLRLAAVAAATALALSACGKGSDAAAQQQAAGQQQEHAPEVGVVTVYPQTVALTTELPGRLESVRKAEVRAQVGGIIEKRLFQEGSYVRAGQPLYQIDSSTYQAELESARANLASAEASLAKANADLSRYKPLVDADAISRLEYDAAVTAKRSAEAGVKAAKAAIKSAGISLNRSRITAPISGFIGQSNVSEGTLVSAGDTTVLATIQQTNPMYVNVTQSATDIMKLRQAVADGKLQAVNGGIAVDIKFEDGTVYGQKGRLLFADPSVNESTGQVTLRAAIPNDDNVLLPGLYVRVLMNQADVANAYVVPQQAVTRGDKDTVLIVNAQGGMEPRVVTVAQQQGSNWIITDGLQEGDKVIVDGTMIAGMTGAKKVTPKEWTPPSETAAAAQQAPADEAASAADVQTAPASAAASEAASEQK